MALCNSDNQSKVFDKNIMFFRFPTDPKMVKIWVNACKRKDSFVIKNGRVCSKHFTPDSFKRDLKCELMGLSSKNHRLLKEDAVPTLNLPFAKPAGTPGKEGMEKYCSGSFTFSFSLSEVS